MYGRNVEGALAECGRLEGAQKRGCYHGVGAVLRYRLTDDPTRLARVCGTAGPDELVVCIDGAVDKLSQEQPRWAQNICDGNTGEVAKLCNQAVADGMYKLDKATIGLYYDAAIVGERKPLVGESEHEHHHH